MQRIMVIGPCGAGKSTAAQRIADTLGLPLTHLDRLHWKPGWVEGSLEDLRDELAEIVTQDIWVIDGNYGRSIDLRLERADTVLYLDFPIRLCLWRAAKRVWQFRGRSRPDMTEGCDERFDPAFFWYIAMWNWNARPRNEARIAGSLHKVVRLKSPKELETWLTRLETPDA